MRKKNLLIFATVLVTLVLLLTGCGKQASDKDDEVVAKVNSNEISRTQLDTEIQWLKATNGYYSMEEEQQKAFDEGLEQKALENAIIKQLIFQGAEEKDVVVSEEEAATQLEEMKKQYNSEDEYKQMLTKANITEEGLKQYFQYQSTEQALYEEVTKDIKVNEGDMRSYFEENKADLIKVKVSHILVKAEEGKATEEELQQAEEKAKQIIGELEAGADFAELAKEKSDDTGSAVNGGLIDMYFTENETGLVRPFVDGAFQLAQGEFSKEPVKSQFGYHIIKVDEKLDSFEEMKPVVNEKLMTNEKGDAFTKYFEELKADAEIEKLL
ncbi:peptidylprolyl isomerase [Metallumcola ferriviriculae]|uniref:Peptidylprolyl isomerase n=1 Tax=Metallumcola ferriviriculae TaxID=3039180 RepID=A0AAU0UJR3_9FIRM|nr:peptidylprolyl isomerase [Desulfitibacteraceae bacterium MK1]